MVAGAALAAAIRVGTDFIADEFNRSEQDVRQQITRAGMTLVVPSDLDA
jgi:hypothetical protein